MPQSKLDKLTAEVKACTICDVHLPLGPRPIFQISTSAKILIAGQAPGKQAHEAQKPFNDPSGERLRDWLGLTGEQFYNSTFIAILPMGFCYPGTGKSGDLAPRPECAKEWRKKIFSHLENVELVIVIGQYAIDYHLGSRQKKNLTETVRAWKEYWPAIVPMPHPSPRNNIWLSKNPWFVQEVLPAVRERVSLYTP